MSHFRKDSPKSNRRNFDTQKMEILGELSELCTKLSIEFQDPESFCCIQKNRGTSKDRFISEEDKKVKEGIDLLMKREPEGMEFFFLVGHVKSLVIFLLHALRE